MKSKRLIIWIAIVAVILVLLIVLSVALAIREVEMVFHRYDGKVISAPQNIPQGDIIDAPQRAPTKQFVLDKVKGENVFFLSKSKTLSQLQTPDWYAHAIVKEPGMITVHYVERVLAAKVVNASGQEVFLDAMGNVMEKPDDANCVNITSAFQVVDISSQTVYQPLEFNSTQSAQRLQQVLQVISAMWRCNVEFANISAVLGERDVFTYQNNDLHISMPSGAKIIVHAPSKDLQERMIDAFSAYYNNDDKNLQQPGVVIIVREDGNITTDK